MNAVHAAPPPRTGDEAAARRGAALAARFAHIAQTRMQGIPLLHPGLSVEAVGFSAAAGGAVGVLVTPWFMNLVWMPLDDGAEVAAPGCTREHVLGGERFPFIGAHEDGLGAFEACSLFSPMDAFADQDGAVATARAVLEHLRAADAARASLAAADVATPSDRSRRAMLFGRPRSAA